MSDFVLPYVILPEEFITLLKSNLSTVTTPSPVFDHIRPNRALYELLDAAFDDLDDGRGLEKTMIALGWHNFRNRMASLYISKAIYGKFPNKTDLSLVEDLISFENNFSGSGVQSNSRIFMLAFYFKLAQLKLQKNSDQSQLDLNLPYQQLARVLKLSQGRSEKTDWLILISLHFLQGLGETGFTHSIISGQSFDEIYQFLSPQYRKLMHDNLLTYSASTGEGDMFLFEKV